MSVFPILTKNSVVLDGYWKLQWFFPQQFKLKPYDSQRHNLVFSISKKLHGYVELSFGSKSRQALISRK